VADVSIVDGKNPNPNVMFELGYAMNSLGSRHIVMVFNSAYGEPKNLPFDLGFKKQIIYKIKDQAEDKAQERNRLAGVIENALRIIVRG